jgi:hypothetical protein
MSERHLHQLLRRLRPCGPLRLPLSDNSCAISLERISTGVVANEISSGAFVTLPVNTEETKGPVGLTMRTDTAPSPAFAILLKTIREAASRGG